jgi:hypothetical protein
MVYAFLAIATPLSRLSLPPLSSHPKAVRERTLGIFIDGKRGEGGNERK